jgi:putative transposase
MGARFEPTGAVHRPANRRADAERQRRLEVANTPEFRSLPPSLIRRGQRVPARADRGESLAAESTGYRVLRAADQVEHRGRARPPTRTAPKAHRAPAPNQLWSWDITSVATTVQGMCCYRYRILEVYRRKSVGLAVFEVEAAAHATTVVGRAYRREGSAGQPLVLHSDHGAPMQGATLLATLQKRGVVPSFSRPSVRNDNPYSEALLRTLKYVPSYPSKPFGTVEQARDWALGFQHWYHEEHPHSARKFVTPGERHRGEDKAILARRRAVYAQARAPHPERWSGAPRDGDPDHEVWLNPPKEGRRKAAASQT